MIFIGIDIAKNSHFASAVNSDNEVIVKPFKFTNDDKGFNLFINTFKDFDLSNCLVGLESTGIYGDNLTTFLFSKGFKIGRINPIQTDSLRSSNIRKTKNDKIDTLLIAKCLMLGNYTLVTEKDIEIIKLRTICRFKFDIKNLNQKLKYNWLLALILYFQNLVISLMAICTLNLLMLYLLNIHPQKLLLILELIF